MANLVSVERASLALGTAQVLDAVSLGVGGGDRIGVVGRNGGGKTTLLRVLEGSREVDSGRVARVGSLTIGVLTQDDGMDPAATVHETVIGALPEHVWAADSRIRGTHSPSSSSGAVHRLQLPGTLAAPACNDRVKIAGLVRFEWQSPCLPSCHRQPPIGY